MKRTLAVLVLLAFGVPAWAKDGGAPAKTAAPMVKVVKKVGPAKAEPPAPLGPCCVPVCAAGSALVAPASPVAAVPAPVPAPVIKKEEPAATVGLGKTILSYLIEGLGALLLTVISVLASVLLKKWGFEAQTAKVNHLLGQAVNFAEQKALAKLKADGVKTPGAQKMAMAIELAAGLAKDAKLPDKGKEWWEAKLEAWIGAKKEERKLAGTALAKDLNPTLPAPAAEAPAASESPSS